jgi:hypothetical protein
MLIVINGITLAARSRRASRAFMYVFVSSLQKYTTYDLIDTFCMYQNQSDQNNQ